MLILLEYQNWSEEVFVIKKVKYIFPLMILTEKKLLESFTNKNCKNQIKKNLELKK